MISSGFGTMKRTVKPNASEVASGRSLAPWKVNFGGLVIGLVVFLDDGVAVKCRSGFGCGDRKISDGFVVVMDRWCKRWLMVYEENEEENTA